jgi:hypothetical protein
MTAAENYLLGVWETPHTFTDTSIDGEWTFNLYGHTKDPTTVVGQLFAELYNSSDTTEPMDTTILDDENIGDYTDIYKPHHFTWNDTLSGTIPDGDSLIVGIYVNISNPSGNEIFTQIYNCSDYTLGTANQYVAFCDYNDRNDVINWNYNSYRYLTDPEYVEIGESDDIRANTTDPGTDDEIFVEVVTTITEPIDSLESIDIVFEGNCTTEGDFESYSFGIMYLKFMNK